MKHLTLATMSLFVDDGGSARRESLEDALRGAVGASRGWQTDRDPRDGTLPFNTQPLNENTDKGTQGLNRVD